MPQAQLRGSCCPALPQFALPRAAAPRPPRSGLEKELAALIGSQQIKARIDSHAKVRPAGMDP